jgi:hypothetical protein
MVKCMLLDPVIWSDIEQLQSAVAVQWTKDVLSMILDYLKPNILQLDCPLSLSSSVTTASNVDTPQSVLHLSGTKSQIQLPHLHLFIYQSGRLLHPINIARLPMASTRNPSPDTGKIGCFTFSFSCANDCKFVDFHSRYTEWWLKVERPLRQKDIGTQIITLYYDFDRLWIHSSLNDKWKILYRGPLVHHVSSSDKSIDIGDLVMFRFHIEEVYHSVYLYGRFLPHDFVITQEWNEQRVEEETLLNQQLLQKQPPCLLL